MHVSYYKNIWLVERSCERRKCKGSWRSEGVSVCNKLNGCDFVRKVGGINWHY